MTDLKNALVLITGAGGGFGQQLTRQCLAAGSRLILTDINLQLLDASVTAARKTVSTGEVVQCIASDLSTRDGCEDLAAALPQTPDVIVNNAGIACYGRFDEIPVETWERMVQINLLAPMYVLSLLLAKMIARGSGHIVNIASVAGITGSAGLAPYSATKHALRGFGESLEDELRPFNIKVTTVYPFYSKTPILDSPKFGSLSAVDMPQNILTDPEDVIRAVINGIQRNTSHVFPDATAKQLHWIKRLAPWLIPMLTRRATSRS